MSTKTSLLKRIARTAVVALAGGILSTLVVPSANAAANSSISATCTARAGLGASIVVTANGDGAQLLYATQSSATLSTESATSSVVLNTTVHSVVQDTNTTRTGIMIDGDIMTKRYATITYLVWLDNVANDTNATTPRTTPNGGVAADPFTTVVCTLAGAPAKFSLSASSASVAATESATFTITPQDAAGNTTLLADNETITLTSNFTTALATPGIAVLDADGNRTGSYAAGADLPVANDAAYITGQNLVRNPSETTRKSSTVGADTCAIGSTTSACSISLGAKHADAVSSGVTDTPNIQDTKDSMTATGGFTVNVTNTAAATTTWTVRGSGTVQFISAASSTFTLTTVSYVYGTCFGVGSATALGAAGAAAVAGGGIIDGNQVAPLNTPDKTGTATACKSAGTAFTTTPSASDSYTVSTAKKSCDNYMAVDCSWYFPSNRCCNFNNLKHSSWHYPRDC